MEPALKQRLVGAAVLVALAVIFLPMLIKGPAPESGVGDVPLDMPAGPEGGFETRELPLLPPRAGAAAEDDAPVAATTLPTVDTAAQRDAGGEEADAAGAGSSMMPPTTAGGGYAVTFGSYASQSDAQRVVDALRASQLAGYQEPHARDGRTLHRVRIGPFDSRATAEAARLRAAHVRDDVGSQVVVLDAGAHPDAAELADAPAAAQPAATSPAQQTATPPARPAAAEAPQAARAEPAAPATPPQAPLQTPPTAPAPAAAAGVGFAVQLGSFSSESSALALRDRVRALGVDAFVEAVQTEKGRLHRVQAGPVTDRAAADQLKSRIHARLGIDGLVHSHP